MTSDLYYFLYMSFSFADDGPASEDEDEIEEVTADQVKIHDNTPQTYIIEPFKGILKVRYSELQKFFCITLLALIN